VGEVVSAISPNSMMKNIRPLKQTNRYGERLNDIAFVDQIYYETLTRDIYYSRMRDKQGYPRAKRRGEEL